MNPSNGNAPVSPMRRIAKGLSASSMGQGVNIASRLLEVPVVISFWGVQVYGTWLILNVVAELLSNSDFGLGSVADRVMAREINEGRREETLITYQTALVISLASAVVLCGVALSLFAFHIIQPLLKLSQFVSMETTITVVSVLMLRIPIQLTSRLSQAGLFCVGEYPRGILYAGLGDALTFVALFGAIVAGGDMKAVAIAQCCATVVTAIWLQLSVRRYAPWLKLGFAHARIYKLRELAPPALATFSLSIARSVNYTMPRLVVSLFGGPAAATVFHVHRQLARLINYMILFGRPFQAEIALNYRKDGEHHFGELALRTVQLFVWLAFSACFGVAVLATFFFHYWTRGEVPLDWLLLSLLMMTTLMEALGTSALLPVAGINRHTSVASVFLVANIIAFSAAIPLIGWFGIYGMALALLCVDSATTSRIYVVFAKILGRTVPETIWDALQPPVWLVGGILNIVRERTKSR